MRRWETDSRGQADQLTDQSANDILGLQVANFFSEMLFPPLACTPYLAYLYYCFSHIIRGITSWYAVSQHCSLIGDSLLVQAAIALAGEPEDGRGTSLLTISSQQMCLMN
jgi:hypothetical protein